MDFDPAIFRAMFLTEAAEHLSQLELGLLELEAHPDDHSPIHAVFRAAHSIKGSGATLGFEQVARFTHTLETVLGRIREGTLAVTRERINQLLLSVDIVRALLDCDQTGAPPPAEAEELRNRLEADLASRPSRADTPADQNPPGAASGVPSKRHAPGLRRLLLKIIPNTAFFSTGLDPSILFRDLRAIADVDAVICNLEQIPRLEDLDAEECHLQWLVHLSTECADDELRKVFVFVEGLCEIEICGDNRPNPTDVGEVAIVSAADIGSKPGQPEATAPVATSDPAQSENVVPQATVAVASRGGPTAVKPPGPPTGPHAKAAAPNGTSVDNSTLRVATRKVDQLIDLVGELVIAQSMVKEIADHFSTDRLSALKDSIDLVGRNLQELQHRVLGIRMVPFATVSARLPRLVRDAAERLGKQVTLQINGEETEVDKGVVERLADPLTHLLRNAVAHGIESPEHRRGTGKCEVGEIRVSARHEAGGMVVQISDDGGGLDTAKIRARAEAAGLLQPGQELPDEAIQAMIFQPGFSTAAEVNDICGRGVGLDVVREAVDALNGTLSFTSALHEGTTFVIRLPLTLAILDGLLLQIGSQSFVIPVIAVTEFLRPKKAQVQALGSERGLMLRGEVIPIVRLADVFAIPNAIEDPCTGLVLVIDSDGRRFGLLVDGLIGQSQVVLKSLEANYRRIDGVLGATILADGGIALIVDVAGLTRMTRVKRLPGLVAA